MGKHQSEGGSKRKPPTRHGGEQTVITIGPGGGRGGRTSQAAFGEVLVAGVGVAARRVVE